MNLSLFWTGRPLLFCECRTKILESEKFFLLSVPKDDAVIKCWNTPSLISHMLHIHILLWCSIYYARFKLHYKLMHFNMRTFNKVHFVQYTYFPPWQFLKTLPHIQSWFLPLFSVTKFLSTPYTCRFQRDIVQL